MYHGAGIGDAVLHSVHVCLFHRRKMKNCGKMDFIKGNYIAGGVFIKDFPYHLQAAGIKVHLLFSAQLGSHSAVNFTVAGQIALMGKIKTKIPYLNGKLFPAVK